MRSLDITAGIDSAAVNLFIERAHSITPDFSIAQPMKPLQSLRSAAPRRDSIGHRAGRLAHGVDDRRQRFVTVWISGSDCWLAPGAAWSATKHCATRWRGPMTCSTTPKRRCWISVRCSPVGLICTAPAR